jgi:SsrA-binding protein
VDNVKVIATNRKAGHNYFLLDKYEAGIALKGSEIKSIRSGQISIKEAYVRTDGNEVWLVNAHIAAYNPASHLNHDPKRDRKLLLQKKEIIHLWAEVSQKGVTIVPLRVYLKNGKAKVEIAVAKGKSKGDKRYKISRREAEQEIKKALRRR